MLSADIEARQLSLKTVKQKRDQYLDSLVTGGFSKDERDKITARIDEFSLEEKQTQAQLYKLEFEKTETSEKLLTIDSFKQAIVTFKFNHLKLSESELKQWLKDNILKIVYQENTVDIAFRLLEDSS